MTKIAKDFDVVGSEPPAFDRGTNPFDNPQIQPNSVPKTPGEKASNSTAPVSTNQAQPFKKFGSGFTD